MASHYVVGDSPFLKRVLIPFWTLRIVLMAIEIVAYIMAIVMLSSNSNNGVIDQSPSAFRTAMAVAIVFLLIIIATLVLDIVCIYKRVKRTLSPLFFLVVNVIQTAIWTVLFALWTSATGNPVSIGINVVTYASFVGLLIYAIVVFFHRHRKGTLEETRKPGHELSEATNTNAANNV